MEKQTLKIKQGVAIVGANGYSGLELARLLLKHPEADLKACFARDDKWLLSDDLNDEAAKLVPTLKISDLACMAPHLNAVFLATPAEVSLELAPLLVKKTKVIDLSGAYRLESPDFEKFYKIPHGSPELISQTEYGLVPWTHSKNTSLISNPGCYATSCLMALIPLLKENLIDPSQIVIDAKSGTTGGGKKAKQDLLFSEVEGLCLPYKVGTHQHLPEIKRFADLFSGQKTDIQFTTHLLPVRRGIISSLYLKKSSTHAALSDRQLLALIKNAFTKAYAENRLVRFGSTDENPKLLSLRSVVGSPRTHISFTVQDGKIFVFSLIDNLLKGAASQAIENWNAQNLWATSHGLEHLEGVL